MEAESVHVDESRWPLVIVRWPQVTTLAHVEEYFEHRARWLARRQRFVLVIDASVAKGLDADLRRRMAALNRAEADMARRYLAAESIVIVSVVQRAVLTALEWISPPVHPRRTFGTFAEALAWARTTLSPRETQTAP